MAILNTELSQNNNHFLFSDPWSIPKAKPTPRDDNVYICLTGNSGVGKSTILRSIGQQLYQRDNYTIAIDESKLHHPFLEDLFHNTEEYGFQIQLNFMIQRSLIIKKWLDYGYNLVMERSHIEDPVFMEHLLNEGYVTHEEYSTYIELWGFVAKRIPSPDASVLIDVPPEVAIANVTQDEIHGRRPREFPNEETKAHWLTSWHTLYQKLFSDIKADKSNKNVSVYTHDMDLDKFTKQILNQITGYDHD